METRALQLLLILFSSAAIAQSTPPLAPGPVPGGSASPKAGAPAKPQPPAEPQLPVDTIWSCKIDKTDLTVGEKFDLSCGGPAIELDRDKLGLDLQKDQKWTLKILGVKSLSATQGEFMATTWTAGEYRLMNPVLTDGKKRVSLGEIQFKVPSVINPTVNPKGEPYGPWGAAKLGWPLSLWISIALVVLLIAGLVTFKARLSFRRKRLLRTLAANPTTMSPYHQFNKDLRRLQRQIPSTEWGETESRAFFAELDAALRWYLMRVLVVPALDRSASDIARDLRRIDRPVHDKIRRDLVVTIGEIQKARTLKALSVADAHQIAELARGLVDRIHKETEA